jgi:hypothetical protein
VVNDLLEKAVEEIKSIMLANRRRATFIFNNENYRSLNLGEDILRVIKEEECHGNKKV